MVEDEMIVAWLLEDMLTDLGSGLIDHSQKMTMAAMHMADMNV